MSPPRSTKVTIVNQLSSDLTLTRKDLFLGVWTEDMSPPSTIPAGGSVSFQAESNEEGTGDFGLVVYCDPSGYMSMFSFENPYDGSNRYDVMVPKGLFTSHSGGDGDNAEVTWVVGKSP